MFWNCQAIRTYWEEIHKHIKNVFGINISFKCETIYLGAILFENWNINDNELLGILLAASEKTITRKWLKVEPPTTEEWIDIVFTLWKSCLFPSECKMKGFIGSGLNGLSM